jgi:hexosaminidase
MFRYFSSALVLFVLLTGCTAPDPALLPGIIPQPVTIKGLRGSLLLTQEFPGPAVTLNPAAFTHQSEYKISTGRRGIKIEAGDSSGVFYAIQTLRQFAPLDAKGNFCPDSAPVRIPAMEIRDWPKYAWRGLMLDCSRTFLRVEYLKKQIDRLAAYKMNVLHLHLTDDQGWRVEIRRYPELTAVCSKFSPDYPEEISGFYTQQELRELVAYAAERFVTIVPEIEMPGHSSEVFAAFPGLSCRGKVTSIFPFFKGPGITDDIFCAGNDSVFTFLQNVLDEVMELFPSTYIHIGGDEAPKTQWKACKACQARIRTEGLKDEMELQSYFVKRITAYVHSKGRRVIGWDEILEGGLADGAAVMSWRGTEGGSHAAKLGHPVVMSPTSHCYFDYDYKTTSTEEVYSFDPVLAGLDSATARLILGAQGNFWSHIDRTEPLIDRQIYPRLIALSEVLWSHGKDYGSFSRRLAREYGRMDKLGINYYRQD